MLMEVLFWVDLCLIWVFLLDVIGQIFDWISWQDVVCFYVCDVVVWMLGDLCFIVYGGMNCEWGEQSMLELYLIIVSIGYCCDYVFDLVFVFMNIVLFVCDCYICLYCGNYYNCGEFICDYVQLVFKGGCDEWENVVSVCLVCNLCKVNCILQ